MTREELDTALEGKTYDKHIPVSETEEGFVFHSEEAGEPVVIVAPLDTLTTQ